MKISLRPGATLVLVIGLLPVPIWAQAQMSSLARQTTPLAPHLAAKSVFAEGFGEPSGLARDVNGHLYVSDEQRGEVVELSLQGARFGVLVGGLQAPSGIASPVWGGSNLLVCERGADRVIALSLDGKITPWGGTLEQPINISRGEVGDPLVMSAKNFEPLRGFTLFPMGSYLGEGLELPHTWNPLLPPVTPTEIRPEWNFALRRDSDYLLSAPSTGTIWQFSDGKKLQMFAQGLGKPTALSIGADKSLYVCDESAGGRLLRLDEQGHATVVASELGRPCAVVWANSRRAFVANRAGNIWRLNF